MAELAEGETGSIHKAPFPVYDAELAQDTSVTIGVQIAGKLRGDITIAPDATEEVALAAVRADEKLAGYIDGGIKKVIYVQRRILNIIPE